MRCSFFSSQGRGFCLRVPTLETLTRIKIYECAHSDIVQAVAATHELQTKMNTACHIRRTEWQVFKKGNYYDW